MIQDESFHVPVARRGDARRNGLGRVRSRGVVSEGRSRIRPELCAGGVKSKAAYVQCISTGFYADVPHYILHLDLHLHS